MRARRIDIETSLLQLTSTVRLAVIGTLHGLKTRYARLL